MNDIYILRRYKTMGICGDILFARFMWLKSKGAKGPSPRYSVQTPQWRTPLSRG